VRCCSVNHCRAADGVSLIGLLGLFVTCWLMTQFLPLGISFKLGVAGPNLSSFIGGSADALAALLLLCLFLYFSSYPLRLVCSFGYCLLLFIISR
jgi:hypothetical protein